MDWLFLLTDNHKAYVVCNLKLCIDFKELVPFVVDTPFLAL